MGVFAHDAIQTYHRPLLWPGFGRRHARNRQTGQKHRPWRRCWSVFRSQHRCHGCLTIFCHHWLSIPQARRFHCLVTNTAAHAGHNHGIQAPFQDQIRRYRQSIGLWQPVFMRLVAFILACSRRSRADFSAALIRSCSPRISSAQASGDIGPVEFSICHR